MEERNPNVLEFPMHKVKLSRKASEAVETAKKSTSFELENRKVLTSMSLLSILLAVVIANQEITSTNTAPTPMTQSRGIASFGEPVEVVRNTEWEKKLAQELSTERTEAESLVIRGNKPSELDHLMFGTLGGQYLVSLDKGKLAEIEFNPEAFGLGEPQKLDDRAHFIQANRALLSVDFDTVKKSRISSEAETYALLKSGNEVGEVTFELDTDGRLLSMKFESTQRVALNR